jgi:ATP-dependent exoDNAse (exonuclease V) alpha subunit
MMNRAEIIVTAITNLAIENVRRMLLADGAIDDNLIEFTSLYSLIHRKGRVLDGAEGIDRTIYILIDEASMIDEKLAQLLGRLEREGTRRIRLLALGDVRQLGPVNHTSIFTLMLDKLPKAAQIELKTNYRCSDLILENAGKLWVDTEEYHILATPYLELTEKSENFSVTYNFDEISPQILRDAMVITYANDDVAEFNGRIAQKLRRNDLDDRNLMFYPDDKCMYTRSNPSKRIYNNSMCTYVTDLGKCALVRYNDQLIEVSHKDLVLAYAITIHKAQGQQSDIVVIILRGEWFEKTLINTAITRAKKKVIIVRVGIDLPEPEQED